MRPGSAIINIASVAALASGGLPQAAYSASKAGLIGLTRDLAVQWTGRKGIRVTAVAPGYFPSEMTEQFPQGYIDSQLPRVPMHAASVTRRSSRLPSSSSPAQPLATSPEPLWSSTAA